MVLAGIKSLNFLIPSFLDGPIVAVADEPVAVDVVLTVTVCASFLVAHELVRAAIANVAKTK